VPASYFNQHVGSGLQALQHARMHARTHVYTSARFGFFHTASVSNTLDITSFIDPPAGLIWVVSSSHVACSAGCPKQWLIRMREYVSTRTARCAQTEKCTKWDGGWVFGTLLTHLRRQAQYKRPELVPCVVSKPCSPANIGRTLQKTWTTTATYFGDAAFQCGLPSLL